MEEIITGCYENARTDCYEPKSDNPYMGKERDDWASRFNQCCDKHGIPAKGKNRQAIVAKLFGVSQVGARKWLEGEAMPQLDKCIEMAKVFGVSFEWFMTGWGLPSGNSHHDIPVGFALIPDRRRVERRLE